MKIPGTAIILLALITVLAGGFAEGPDDMTLPRIKAKMSQNYTRLPNYTCLQVIDEFRGRESDEMEKPVRQLRLELGFINGQDRFARPGGATFDGKPLMEVAPSGAIGAGSFAAPTRSVFLSQATKFTFVAEENCGGRACFRFDFAASAEDSKHHFAVGASGGRVPYHGQVLVEADTLDPVRLEFIIDELPPVVKIDSATTVIEYEKLQIKGREFILPRRATVTMADRSGHKIRNETVLSDFLEHPAPEGMIRAGANPAGETDLAGNVADLPAGLRLQLVLDAELDPDKSMPGDPIQATVSSNAKQGDEIVAPKGAVAHGRLVVFQESSQDKSYRMIGVIFDRLVFDEQEVRLAANVQGVELAKGDNVTEVMGFVGARRSATLMESAQPMRQANVTSQDRSVAFFLVKKKEVKKIKGVKITLETR